MIPSGHRVFLVHNVGDVDILLMHHRTYAAEYVENSKRLQEGSADAELGSPTPFLLARGLRLSRGPRSSVSRSRTPRPRSPLSRNGDFFFSGARI